MIALASAIAAVAAGQAVLTLAPGVRASSAVLPPAAAPLRAPPP